MKNKFNVNSVSKSNFKDTLTLDYQDLTHQIEDLYNKIKKLIKEEKLEEAEKIKLHIIKKEEEKDKLKYLLDNRNKKYTLDGLKEEHEDILKQFNQEWKEKFLENDKNKKNSLDEVKKSHKNQLQEMHKMKDNLIINFKENALIKEYREKKELLMKMNSFKEAKMMDKKISQVKKEDDKKYLIEKEKKFNELINKLKKSHLVELNYLENKLKSIENELIKEKDYDYNILLKKIMTNKVNVELNEGKNIKKINKNYKNINLKKNDNNDTINSNVFPSYLSSISKNNTSNFMSQSRINIDKKFSINKIYKY